MLYLGIAFSKKACQEPLSDIYIFFQEKIPENFLTALANRIGSTILVGAHTYFDNPVSVDPS